MKHINRFAILFSSGAFVLCSNAVHAAGVVYPSVDLQGSGTSSIIVLLNKTLQCLGNPDAPIGFSSNTAGLVQSFYTHNYQPLAPTGANPAYNCATQSIQPSLTAHYVSSGSGVGKTNWSSFNTSGIINNPFIYGSHVQYAFSDSPIKTIHLSTYNSVAIPHGTGAAIQIPFYVLPVAIAYSPIYGRHNTGSAVVNLSFNVKSTFVQKDGAGNPTGGLRMKRTTYCGIMNGTITNWNDAALKADNGGQSLMDPNDDPYRWDTIGVPIKLVGRSDDSGTTNILTRHLTVACGGDYTAGGEDQLPSARKSIVRYDRQTGAPISSEWLGKFGLVDGSDGIRTVVSQPIPNPVSGATNLGGWLGYVGADWVTPSIGSLFSVALQQNASTVFKMPSAANATTAFGTAYLPPQSTTAGKYTLTPPPGSVGSRSNPFAWVLPANATDKLANPLVGYPIVGTTNALLYTCYASDAKRLGIVALAALQFGKLTEDSIGANIPTALITNTAKGADGLPIGILPRYGVASLPSSWKTAIWETFFQKVSTGNNPSSLNLWIQDKLPTAQTQIDGDPANGELLSNPSCTAGQGA